MRRIFGVLSVMTMLFAFPANAEFNAGFSIIAGQYETDGTETEKTVSGVTSETNSASKSEMFYGGSLFAEFETEGGIVIGLDYVPLDINLGSGKRTDSSTGADVAAEADTGDRSAEANIEDLYTIYTHIPVGEYYAILGYHDANVTTKETLQTSTYGDTSINGFQYGIGMKRGDSMRIELSYSDFDSISLTSSANTNKITADADALAAKISFAF